MFEGFVVFAFGRLEDRLRRIEGYIPNCNKLNHTPSPPKGRSVTAKRGQRMSYVVLTAAEASKQGFTVKEEYNDPFWVIGNTRTKEVIGEDSGPQADRLLVKALNKAYKEGYEKGKSECVK